MGQENNKPEVPRNDDLQLEHAGAVILSRLNAAFGPANACVPGNRLGKWTLRSPETSGGFATLWKAEGEDGVVAAVKVFTPTAEREIVRAEAEALCAAQCPHVPQFYEVSTESSPCWIAMELVEGVSLADQIRKTGPAKRELSVLTSVISAVASLHKVESTHLVHGDLTPRNIITDSTEKAWLVDFGSAFATKDHTATDTSPVAATRPVSTSLDYRVPEIQCGHRGSQSSDVYQLGLVCFEWLTGDNFAERCRQEDPDRVLSRLTLNDPSRTDVLRRALSWTPSDRFASAVEMLDAWNGVAAHTRSAFRRRRVAIVAGILASAVLWVFVRVTRNSPTASRDSQAFGQHSPAEGPNVTESGGSSSSSAEAYDSIRDGLLPAWLRYIKPTPFGSIPVDKYAEMKQRMHNEALRACKKWQASFPGKVSAVARSVSEMTRWIKGSENPLQLKIRVAVQADRTVSAVHCYCVSGELIPTSAGVDAIEFAATLRRHDPIILNAHLPEGPPARLVVSWQYAMRGFVNASERTLFERVRGVDFAITMTSAKSDPPPPTLGEAFLDQPSADILPTP